MIKAIDYCQSVFDGTHDTPKPTNSGYRLLTSKNIVNGSLNKEDSYFISKKDFDLVNKRSAVKKWDILFSMIGTVGNICLISEENPDFAIKNIGVFSCDNEYKAKWLYFYLQSPYAKKVIDNYLNGAVQKFLSLDMLRNFPVPEFDEQSSKIVDMLWNIEKKLLNNNSIINDIEDILRTTYERWFIQFDYPNVNDKPYKSSGGEMIFNEELKREIPKGWEVKKLSSIIDISSNKLKKKINSEMYYVPIEVLPRKKISFYETANIEKAATGLCEFNEKSILLSNRRVYFHKICISPFNGITRDTVIIMNPRESYNLAFSYELMNTEHFIEYATRNSYGTEQPVLAPQTVLDYKFPCSDNNLEKKYSNIMNIYIDQVLALERENKKLVEIKDFLLPLLMNGQVK